VYAASGFRGAIYEEEAGDVLFLTRPV
jgi:hypothetical protein